MTDEEFLKWQQQRKTPVGTMSDEEFLAWQKAPVTKRRKRNEIAELQSELEDWRQRVPAPSPEAVLRHQIGSQTAVKPIEREKTLLEQAGDYLKAVGAGAWSKSAETAGTILDTAARLLYALGTPAPWDPQKAKQAVKPYEETALGQHFERNLAVLGRVSTETAEQAEETGGLVGRVFYEAATEVPKQIALGASGKILGDLIAVGQPAWQSVARLLPFMATAGIAGARQAKREGAKPYQQALMGLSAAGIAGATESLNLDEWLKVFGRSGGGELVFEGATRAARAGALGKVLDWLRPWAVPVGELVEEELEDPLIGLAKKSIYRPETPWTGPEGVFDLQRAGETAFATGWYIVLLGAFGLPRQLKAYRMANEMLQRNKPPTVEQVEELRRQVDEDLRNLPNKAAAEIAGMSVAEQIEAMRKMREEMARKAETTKTETQAETRTETKTEPRPEPTLEQLASIRAWWAERAANPWLGQEADRQYALGVMNSFDEEIAQRVGRNLTETGASIMVTDPNAPKVGDKYNPEIIAEIVEIREVSKVPTGMKPDDEFILEVVRQGWGTDEVSRPRIVLGKIAAAEVGETSGPRKMANPELIKWIESRERPGYPTTSLIGLIRNPEQPNRAVLLEDIERYLNQNLAAYEEYKAKAETMPELRKFVDEYEVAKRVYDGSKAGKTPSRPDGGGKIAERLRKSAEALTKQIEAKRSPATAQQRLTARRARIMERMSFEAGRLERIQRLMLALADAHEQGVVPKSLKGITSKLQIEELNRNIYPRPIVYRDMVENLLIKAQGADETARRTVESIAQRGEVVALSGEDEIRAIEVLIKAADYPHSGFSEAVASYRRLVNAGITDESQFEQAKRDLEALVPTRPEIDVRRQRVQQLEHGLIGRKIPGFFPTPRELAGRMVEMADIKSGMRVLEPSAGNGAIADVIAEVKGVQLDTIEINSSLREILEAKGHNVVASDFETYNPGPIYDRIVMNPPFERGQDVDHVRHAFELLKPGGTLVSIMGEHSFFAEDKKSVTFREWLEQTDGISERLPAGTFTKEMQATSSNARLVIVKKPTVKETKAKESAARKEAALNLNEVSISARTPSNVGDQRVKSYQSLHPELAPFIQRMAGLLRSELPTDAGGGQGGKTWTRTEEGDIPQRYKRRTEPYFERIKDEFGGTWTEIHDALGRIAHNEGAENTALAKKIELVIDELLSKGFTSRHYGEILPDAEYIRTKARVENRELTPEEEAAIEEAERFEREHRKRFQMETLKHVHEEADRLIKASGQIKLVEVQPGLTGGYGVIYTINSEQKVAVVDPAGEIFLMDEDWAEAINHVRFDPDDPLKSIQQAYWQLAKDKVAAVKEQYGGEEGIQEILSHELGSTIKPPPPPPEQGALFEGEQKRRKGVFNEKVPSGRADMGGYVDAKRRFERVRQLVREGVFEDRPGRRADMGGYATEEEIAGRTAIHRRAVSMPVRKLVEAGLISGRVLHHGRGLADADAEALRAAGGAYAEYDPNYAPDRAVLNEKYDTVVSNYVLNVLPPKERAEAWKDLANTTGAIAFITVRTVGDKSIKGTPYQDGVRTSKGTFQKAYTVEEFENEARRYFGAVQLVFGSDKSGSATFCVMHGAEKSAGYQVAYTDANGKGHTKFFDTVEEMETFIRKLRHPAIVKDASGEQIGRVWFDDGRWQWYHEAKESRVSRYADMGGYADQGNYLGLKKQEETREGAPKRPERDREYAERLRARIELPELVEMAKELLEGKYPRVRERLGRMLGRALLPQGSGEARVDLRADIFIGPVLEQQIGGDRAEFEQRIAEKYGDDLEDIVIKSYYNRKTRTTTYVAYRKDPAFAAKVLGHEIGHVIDWLEDKELRRGNILGHLASFKHYMEKFLAEYPGAPESATLTDEDRARLKAEAARIVEEEKKAREPQGVEGTGITAQDILDIFNTVSGGEKNPALLTYIKSLSPAEKISIVKQALKGIVAPGVVEGVARVDTSKRYTDWDKRLKTVFERLVKEELAKRQLYSEEVIRKELKDLTLTWKPFAPRKNDSYTQYRFSSPELYADAFSVLVNEPELLQTIAPTFYRAFFNWFEQKPHVKRLYDRIQERIGNIEEILDTRLTKDYEMLAAGHAERKRLREARRSLIKGFGYTVMRWLVDKNQGTLGTVRAIERQSGTRWLAPRKETAPEAFAARRVRTELEEAAHIGDEIGNYVHRVGEVLKILNDADLWVDDLGVYMLHMRASTERSTMANPRGTTATTSKDALDRMRERLGTERFAALEKAADTYRRIREELIIPRAEQSRMYSPRLISVMKNSKHYARFSVIKYLQKRYGTAGTARVYRQIGTLEEIENPFVATVIQDMSVLRAAKLNEAKLAIINMLQGLPDAIRPAKTKWSSDLGGHVAVEPDEPGWALFSVMFDGKLESFYVDETIAKDFERAPFEAHKVAEVLRLMFNPVKQALVSKNVLWMARNVWKDFKGTVLKNPEIRLRDIPKFLGYYIKVHREVVNEVFKGERSEHIEQMMRQYMLIPHRAYTGKDYDYETEIDRLAEEFGVNPRRQLIEAKEARTAMGKFWQRVKYGPFGQKIKLFWDWLEKPGRYTEVIAKVAGERYLTEQTELTAQEVAHRVRTRVGTPDARRIGSAHQLTNNVWIFSNIGKEGMRASWEAFRENPGAYIWKAIWLSVMPKLALAAVGSSLMAAMLRKLGVRDPERWKRIVDAIPEYDKQNYQCVPLGMTRDGRAVYLRLPEDYDGQFWGKLAWTLVHGKFTGKQSAAAAVIEQSPYDANPYLVIGAQWVAFLQGQNPIDEYYGTPVIPEQEFAAGGIEPFLTMLKRTVGELGGDAIYRPARRDERESRFEGLLRIFPINTIGQFIKITDAGTKEKFYEEQEKIERERARKAVSIRRRVQEVVQAAKGHPTYEMIQDLYLDLTKSGVIDTEKESFAQFAVNRFYPYAASRVANPQVGMILKLRSTEERSRMLRRLRRTLKPEEYQEVVRQLDDLGVSYYE